MLNTNQPFGKQVEGLRQENVESLKSRIISERNTNKEGIPELIRSFTEGMVKVEFLDDFSVRVLTQEGYSKKYLLFTGEEIEPEEIIVDDLHDLCEYLVNKSLYDYSGVFKESLEKL